MLLFIERVKELVDFFEPYFINEEETKKFIEGFENLSEEKLNAWLAFNQTERLITLANEIYKIKRRDPLRLLFLIICAEAVAKLCKDFKNGGDSYEYTKIFFTEFCEPKDMERLNGSIVIQKGQQEKPLPLEEVIDYLYKVRCSVVHEGRYWDFTFKDPRLSFLVGVNFKNNEVYSPKITYEELCDIVVRGAIKAIKAYIKK